MIEENLNNIANAIENNDFSNVIDDLSIVLEYAKNLNTEKETLKTEIENLSCGIGKVLLPALSGRKADDFLLTRLKQKAISTTRAQTGQEKRIRAHFEHGFAFKI